MSDTTRQVLQMLVGGDLVSGASIGDKLGISRAAVWKHLRLLKEWGIPLQAIKGRGYCLNGGMELLSRQQIIQAMSSESQALLKELQLIDQVDSTNSLARLQIEQGVTTGYACLSERQTQGRGRLGRNWQSPFGRNMYLSAIWEFQGGVVALEGLSLAVGVAVCSAIEGFGVNTITLKWPNDILLDGRKVGGILVEMVGDPMGVCQVVVGIGVNFGMPREVEIDQPWADLCEHPAVSRNGLAGKVLGELLPLLAGYSDAGFGHYRQAWEAYDAHRNERVQLSTPGKVVQGIARGVAESGAICIEIDGQRMEFSGGEISLRRI